MTSPDAVESAGWHADPIGRHDLRFWSGAEWTEHVADSYLLNWNPEDFRKLAAALGLHLYGLPKRSLDSFHSGRSEERGVRLLAGSAVAGMVIRIAFPLLFLVAVLVALLLKAAHH